MLISPPRKSGYLFPVLFLLAIPKACSIEMESVVVPKRARKKGVELSSQWGHLVHAVMTHGMTLRRCLIYCEHL